MYDQVYCNICRQKEIQESSLEENCSCPRAPEEEAARPPQFGTGAVQSAMIRRSYDALLLAHLNAKCTVVDAASMRYTGC